MSILPDLIRVIPNCQYCPLKKDKHSSCTTCLILKQNGYRRISCLSNNHENNQNALFVPPDAKNHAALAKVLTHVWGIQAWRHELNKRFFMVYNNQKSIACMTTDQEGYNNIEFRAPAMVEQMFRGNKVYVPINRAPDNNNTTATTTTTTSSKVESELLWKVQDSPINVWLNWEERRRFKGITYVPEGQCPGFINMWSGFGITPKEGHPRVILQHIYEVICSKNETYYNFVLNCLAHLVQYPAIKLGIILVLYGRKGTGKSALGEVLKLIFARHAIEIVNARHFAGNFNMHNRYKNLIIFNEAFWGGDKLAESVMKAAVTESSTIFEGKGVDCIEGTNYWNMIITSDNPFCAPITVDNRRFFVLELSDHRKGDATYFRNFYNAIENDEEIEEFLYYLKNRSLPPKWRAPENLPKTTTEIDMLLQDCKNAGLSWMINKAREGEWITNYGLQGSQIIKLNEESSPFSKDFILGAFQLERQNDPILFKNVKVNDIGSLTKFFHRIIGKDNFRSLDTGKSNVPRYVYQFSSMQDIRTYIEATLKVEIFDRNDEL